MTDRLTSVIELIENLRSNNPELRLASTKALHYISQALGPERVRTELIPYIMDYNDDDDEVLEMLATMLGSMMNAVGGVEYVNCLLMPLESLASISEVTVRDQAIVSLNVLASSIFSPDIRSNTSEITTYLSLVRRMCQNSEPKSRASACHLISVPYNASSELAQQQLRQYFMELCQDEELVVKRSACVALSTHLAKNFNSHCTDFVPIFLKLSQDLNDGIRVQSIPVGIALLPYISDSLSTNVLDQLLELGKDASWRVRFMMADRLNDFINSLSNKEVDIGVSLFLSLSKDAEAEIKASTIYASTNIIKRSNESQRKEILSVLKMISGDENSHVRAMLASLLFSCTELLPKSSISTYIVPLSYQLIQDTDPDVQLALLSAFDNLSTDSSNSREIALIVAPQLIDSIVSSLQSKSSKWRVRESVLRQIPKIILHLDAINAQKLTCACLESLCDRVATIRMAAADGCASLALKNGPEWTKQTLWPHLLKMASTSTFLPRLTFLQVIQRMAPAISSKLAMELIPVLKKMSSDSVSNIRAQVARTITILSTTPCLSSNDSKKMLELFKNDKDMDVRESATCK